MKIELSYPPACVLIQLNLYRLMSQLVMGCVTCHTCHGCVTDFRPILGNPMEVTHVTSPGHVYIFPLPLTESYTLTDYQSQGQTIPHVIVDIGAVPYGKLTPFNVYVALSCSSGQETNDWRS